MKALTGIRVSFVSFVWCVDWAPNVCLVIALRVLETYASTGSTSAQPRPFVYISAEDIFRPLVPARYIESKRAAEVAIAREDRVRGVFLRPGAFFNVTVGLKQD